MDYAMPDLCHTFQELPIQAGPGLEEACHLWKLTLAPILIQR